MKRFENSDHAFGIFVREVKTRCFLKAFEPEFVPQDGNTNKLVTDQERLREQNHAKI